MAEVDKIQQNPKGVVNVPQIRSFGLLLSGSWQIFSYAWRKYLAIFAASVGAFVLIFAAFIGVLFYDRSKLATISSSFSFQAFAPEFAIVAILIIVLIVVSMAIGLAGIHSVISVGEGHPEDPMASLKYGFANLGGFLAATLLAGLAVFAGTLIFIVPGIIIGLMFSQIAAIVVVEGMTGSSALSRSNQLTRGNKWILFIRYGQLFLVLFLFSLASNLFNFLPYISNVISLVVSFVTTPISIAYGYLMYKDLTSVPQVVAKN